jgi:Protein of unknown function (DUF2950)
MLMNSNKSQSFLLALALSFASLSAAFAAQSSSPASTQKLFSSPEEAAKAYAAACEQQDPAALLALLGSANQELVNSGDASQDTRRRERFANMAKESLEVQPDPYDTTRFLVYVGNRHWPLPIPIVKSNNSFRFDPAAAKAEILARRIGHNELDAIAFLRQFVLAEIDYAYADLNQNGVREYTRNIVSTPGTYDGLYWESVEGGPVSPLAEVVEKAIAQGYVLAGPGEPFTYHGYVFRILTSQGPNASGGARDYIGHDYMIGGFAMAAYPLEYAVSGVKTFLVNQDGIVSEKDLGANSNKIAAAFKSYDPDKTWKESPQEESEEASAPVKP